MSQQTDVRIHLDLAGALAIARGLRLHGILAGVPDDQAQARFEEDWPQGVGLRPSSAELLVAAYDEERALHRDAECDPFPRNQVYVDWVQGFAAISRGGLALKRVEERWLCEPDEAADHHPVEIHVETDRARHVFRPFQAGDYVHPGDLAAGLNVLLPQGAPTFRNVATGGQDAFLIALTDAEKRRLETERGWVFHAPTTPLEGK